MVYKSFGRIIQLRNNFVLKYLKKKRNLIQKNNVIKFGLVEKYSKIEDDRVIKKVIKDTSTGISITKIKIN